MRNQHLSGTSSDLYGERDKGSTNRQWRSRCEFGQYFDSSNCCATIVTNKGPLSQTEGHGRGRRNIESEVQVRISVNSLLMGKRLSALTTTEYVV
jgi:hypothetical protein